MTSLTNQKILVRNVGLNSIGGKYYYFIIFQLSRISQLHTKSGLLLKFYMMLALVLLVVSKLCIIMQRLNLLINNYAWNLRKVRIVQCKLKF